MRTLRFFFSDRFVIEFTEPIQFDEILPMIY